jgi:hypothetical protein
MYDSTTVKHHLTLVTQKNKNTPEKLGLPLIILYYIKRYILSPFLFKDAQTMVS